jgi:hypothetical protein
MQGRTLILTVIEVAKKPKYVHHLIREAVILDSAAVKVDSDTYIISDRCSPFKAGEKPEAVVSLIKEGDRDYQLRIAVRGEFHREKPFYYVVPPDEWIEWAWIIIPRSEFRKLMRILHSLVDGNTPLHELM